MWYLKLHWVSISTTESSAAVCVIGWESRSTVPVTLVQSVMEVDDPFGVHQVDCGGNGDSHNGSGDVLFSAAQSPALAPIKEASNPAPAPVQQIFFS